MLNSKKENLLEIKKIISAAENILSHGVFSGDKSSILNANLKNLAKILERISASKLPEVKLGQYLKELFDIFFEIKSELTILGGLFYEVCFVANDRRFYLSVDDNDSIVRTEEPSVFELRKVGDSFRLYTKTGRYVGINKNKKMVLLNGPSDSTHALKVFPGKSKGVYVLSCVNLSVGYNKITGELSLNSNSTNDLLFNFNIDSSLPNFILFRELNKLLTLSPNLYFYIRDKYYEGNSEEQIGADELLYNIFYSNKEKDIAKFFYNIFPKLQDAQDRSLILFIGNKGAGKSTFVNYMLGHRFEDRVKKDAATMSESEGSSSTEGWGSDGDSQDDESDDVIQTEKSEGGGVKKNNIIVVAKEGTRFADIGNTSTAVTAYPTIYRSHHQDEFSFCDCPGFEKSDKNGLHAFSLMMIKEMANKITAVVIVIDHQELYVTRGEQVKSLINILKSIMSFEENEDFSKNILFLINTKGQSDCTGGPLNRKNVLDRFKEIKNDFINSDTYQTYLKLIAHCDDNNLNLEKVVQGGANKFLSNLPKPLKDSLLNYSGELTIKEKHLTKLQREGEGTREALLVLGLIKKRNLLVWSKPITIENKKTRDLFLDRFRKLDVLPSGSVFRETLRFENAFFDKPEYLVRLNDWVGRMFSVPFAELRSFSASLSEKLYEDDVLRIEDSEKKEIELRKIIERKFRILLLCKSKLTQLNETVLFQAIKLPEERFTFSEFVARLKKGHAHAILETDSYEPKVLWTKISYRSSQEIKGVKRVKEKFTKPDDAPEGRASVVGNKATHAVMLESVNLEKFPQYINRQAADTIQQEKLMSKVEEIEQWVEGVKKEEQVKKYSDYSAGYKLEDWSGSIKSQEVASILGLKKDLPESAGEEEWLVQYMQLMIKEIKSYKEKIEALRSNDTDKVNAVLESHLLKSAEIVSIRCVMDNYRKVINESESYFLQAYDDMFSIKQVLDRVNQYVVTRTYEDKSYQYEMNYSSFVNFLESCRMVYHSNSANQKRMSSFTSGQRINSLNAITGEMPYASCENLVNYYNRNKQRLKESSEIDQLENIAIKVIFNADELSQRNWRDLAFLVKMESSTVTKKLLVKISDEIESNHSNIEGGWSFDLLSACLKHVIHDETKKAQSIRDQALIYIAGELNKKIESSQTDNGIPDDIVLSAVMVLTQIFTLLGASSGVGIQVYEKTESILKELKTNLKDDKAREANPGLKAWVYNALWGLKSLNAIRTMTDKKNSQKKAFKEFSSFIKDTTIATASLAGGTVTLALAATATAVSGGLAGELLIPAIFTFIGSLGVSGMACYDALNHGIRGYQLLKGPHQAKSRPFAALKDSSNLKKLLINLSFYLHQRNKDWIHNVNVGLAVTVDEGNEWKAKMMASGSVAVVFCWEESKWKILLNYTVGSDPVTKELSLIDDSLFEFLNEYANKYAGNAYKQVSPTKQKDKRDLIKKIKKIVTEKDVFLRPNCVERAIFESKYISDQFSLSRLKLSDNKEEILQAIILLNQLLEYQSAAKPEMGIEISSELNKISHLVLELYTWFYRQCQDSSIKELLIWASQQLQSFGYSSFAKSREYFVPRPKNLSANDISNYQLSDEKAMSKEKYKTAKEYFKALTFFDTVFSSLGKEQKEEEISGVLCLKEIWQGANYFQYDECLDKALVINKTIEKNLAKKKKVGKIKGEFVRHVNSEVSSTESAFSYWGRELAPLLKRVAEDYKKELDYLAREKSRITEILSGSRSNGSSNFEDRLKKLGLKPQRLQNASGECFFHSIIKCSQRKKIIRIARQESLLRHGLSQYILNNKEEYEKKGKIPEKYAQDIANGNSLLDRVAIQAFSEKYEIALVIVYHEESKLKVFGVLQDPKDIFYLGCSEKRYTPLLNEDNARLRDYLSSKIKFSPEIDLLTSTEMILN